MDPSDHMNLIQTGCFWLGVIFTAIGAGFFGLILYFLTR